MRPPAGILLDVTLVRDAYFGMLHHQWQARLYLAIDPRPGSVFFGTPHDWSGRH